MVSDVEQVAEGTDGGGAPGHARRRRRRRHVRPPVAGVAARGLRVVPDVDVGGVGQPQGPAPQGHGRHQRLVAGLPSGILPSFLGLYRVSWFPVMFTRLFLPSFPSTLESRSSRLGLFIDLMLVIRFDSFAGFYRVLHETTGRKDWILLGFTRIYRLKNDIFLTFFSYLSFFLLGFYRVFFCYFMELGPSRLGSFIYFMRIIRFDRFYGAFTEFFTSELGTKMKFYWVFAGFLPSFT